MVKSSFIQPTLTCDKTAKGYQVRSSGMESMASLTAQSNRGGTEGYCHNGKGPFYDTWWEQYRRTTSRMSAPLCTPVTGSPCPLVAERTEYTVKVTDATRRPTASRTASAARRRPARIRRPSGLQRHRLTRPTTRCIHSSSSQVANSNSSVAKRQHERHDQDVSQTTRSPW